MSLHYILDGYNIIYKIHPFQCSSSQKSREKLIRYIQNKRPQGSHKNKVTIVFDGTKDVPEYSQATSPIEVIFTNDTTADDYIIKLIKCASNPKTITVVSDDRELQKRVILLDAKVAGVKDFFKSIKSERIESDKSSLTRLELQIIEDELLGRRKNTNKI